MVLASLIAIATTLLVLNDLTEREPAAGVYPVIALAGLVGAWLAVFGWASDRRLLAAVGHVLSIGAPWDFFYPGALLAIVLAVVAVATFRNTQHQTPLA